MNLKLGGLVSLCVAACLPMAAIATQVQVPPKTLDTLETHAEDALDHAANQQWGLVRQDARATVTAWRTLRSDLVKQNVPRSTVSAMDQRVAEFDRAASAQAPNRLMIEQRANAVTALVPDVEAHYRTAVPVQVGRLDYLGRQIQLDHQANQPSEARRHAGTLRSAWSTLRSQALQVAPTAARAIDRDVAQIASGPTSRAAMLASKDLLDKVDELEKGFLTASTKRSMGGGAGSAPGGRHQAP